MQQILVIENVDLWIILNRHFAGSDSVQVSETPTWKTGVRFAKSHSPVLIICKPRSDERSAAELRADLDQAGLESIPFLCVRDAKPSHDANGASDSSGSQLIQCKPSELIEVVNCLLMSGPPQEDPPALVDLLAHYEYATGQPGEPQRGFVNLTEIHVDSLTFESNQPLQVGDHLELTFFLPRPQLEITTSNRLKVSLVCEIKSCLDEGKLRYQGDVTSIDEALGEAIRQFVEGRRTHGRGTE